MQIGIWSQVLTDLCRIDVEADKQNDDDDDKRRDVKLKPFRLLDELSDLLMLPKDNLLNDATRKEVSFLVHNTTLFVLVFS